MHEGVWTHAIAYLDSLRATLDRLPRDQVEQVTRLLAEAYRHGRRVFLLGNGGSAATASHFACDLGKGTAVEGQRRFRVISLADAAPILTAVANDLAYDRVFSEQLQNLLEPGDVVVGISASGNSANVIQALEYARTQGAVTIGLLGFDGGKARRLVDAYILIENWNYGQVEDIHLMLQHIITQHFRKALSSEGLQ